MDCRQLAQLLVLTLLAACGSTAEAIEPGPPLAAEAEPEKVLEVPQEPWLGWDSSARLIFEQDVRSLQAGPAPSWNEATLEALGQALNEPGPRATRAAILLAHDSGEASSERLLARLEGRHKAPTRGLDAGDIVAAAGLGRRALTSSQVERLLVLVQQGNPHPDLEVRVECAASALASGGHAAAPFLIRVLRTETPAQVQDPRDWERVTTLAWAKGRAADALAAHTGLSHGFRADGSWAHQMRSANLFAKALDLPECNGR